MKSKPRNQIRVMELIEPVTSLMKCKVCGRHHIGIVGANGRIKLGAWQCENGCLLPSLQSAKTVGLSTKQYSRYNSFGSTTEPDEIGIDRGSYDPSYDHHCSYSGGCGNPSDGD